ncbi:MAG: CHAT domain-containing protein [Chloroflexi bacterium]|nr:MAG: CHAT domain-containing protein [Chloroflexota bacterium]
MTEIAKNLTFEIRITLYPPVPHRYRVDVSSPVGENTATLILPLDPTVIEDTLREYRANIKRPRQEWFPASTPQRSGISILTPEEFGKQLFETIFQERTLELYRESLQQAKKTGKSLSVVLNIQNEAKNLINLPWELLYDTTRRRVRGDFLAFQQDTPVLRRWLDAAPLNFTYDPPLRVLLVSANPENSGMLNIQREMRSIQDKLSSLNQGGQVRVQIDTISAASLDDLKRKIRDPKNTPHIIHFMGHGGVGNLLLENVLGAGHTVGERDLSIILRNATSLRLVVLNACQTGAQAEDVTHQLGVAQSLADVGVPAVVAMQFEISDDAALAFAAEFYQLIAEGRPVETALTWARIAIQNNVKNSGTEEWATPVLYLQVPDGNIFVDLLGTEPAPQKPSPLPPSSQEVPTDTKQPTATEQLRQEDAEKKEKIRHLQELKKRHLQRLNERNLQKATYGIDVPPHITLEIGNIQEQIKEIDRQLQELDPDIIPESPPDATTRILHPYHKPDSQGRATDIQSQAWRFYTRGRDALQGKQWGQALSYLSRARKLAPDLANIDNLVDQARKNWQKTPEGQKADLHLQVLYKGAKDYEQQKQWNKAADLYEEIIRIDADYKDAYLLALETREKAEKEKAEQEKAKKLQQLYERAQASLNKENWDQAVEALVELMALDDHYRDVQALYTQATRQKNLVEAYNEGRQAFEKKDWARAVAAFGRAASIDPNYQDVQTRLTESRRQRQFDAWLKEAEDYLNEEAWDSVIEILSQNQVLQERPEAQLPLSYALAHRHRNDGEWAKAAAELKKILQKRPNYRDDIESLYQSASEEHHLQEQFNKAMKHIGKEEWGAAKATLEAIIQTRPDYPDAKEKLDEVREEIRQSDLYQQALDALEMKQWGAAIRYLQQIPNYKNTQTLLAEAEKQVELDNFWKRGMQALANGEWEKAVSALEKVVQLDKTYKDAQSQLEYAREKIKLQDNYSKGVRALNEGCQTFNLDRLEAAVNYLKTAVDIDPQFRGVENRYREALREKYLLEKYLEGQKAFQAEKWDEAIQCWGEIVTKKNEPDYHGDCSQRLKEAHRQKHLAELYQKAEEYFNRKEWKNAIMVYEQLEKEAGDVSYKDVPEKLAEARIQQKLQHHFEQAEQMLAAEQWDKAIEQLKKIQQLRSSYRQADVRRMLKQAELYRSAAAHYARGLDALKEEQWQQAVDAFEHVQDILPDYRDVDTRLEQARKQNTLHQHYTAARQFMAQEAWDEAIDRLVKIQAIDAGFQDASQLLEEAELQKQLAIYYRTAMEHLQAERWADAIDLLTDILKQKQEYKNAAQLRKQAQQHLEMANRYEQAQKKIEEARKNPDWWYEVVALLTPIVKWNADYQSAAQQLQTAQQQVELLQLYRQATVLGEKNDITNLEKAINLLAQILKVDLNYQNAAELKGEYEARLAQTKEAERQARIRALLEVAAEMAGNLDFAQPEWSADFERLLSHLDKIIGLDKRYARVKEKIQEWVRQYKNQLQEGLKLKEAEKFDEAIGALEKCLELEQNLPRQIKTVLEQALSRTIE